MASFLETEKFSLTSFIPWLIVALVFPVAGRSITPKEIVFTVVSLTGAWALGVLLLSRVKCVVEMSAITKEGVCLLVGSFILYPLCMSPAWLLPSLLLFIVLAYRSKKIALEIPNLPSLFGIITAFSLAILSQVDNGDLTRATSRVPLLIMSSPESIYDTLYLTSMVATLRHGTTSAIYEQGSPLAYQLVSGFMPAVTAASTGLPSQVALWGVWMPLLIVLGFMLIMEVGLRFVSWLDGTFYPLLIALFFFLRPLHPYYILKLQPENFVWRGIGSLMPGGTLTSTASIVWAALALVCIYPYVKEKPARGDLILLAALLITLPGVKMPMYFALFIFVGAAAVLRICKRDYSLAVVLTSTVPLSFLVYKLSFQGSSVVGSVRFGYFSEYIAGLLHSQSLILGFVGSLVLFIVWGSIRLFGLGYLWKTRREVVIATLAALFGCLLAANVLTSYLIRGGVVVEDHSFNMQQFPRHAFFFVSVFGAVGIALWMEGRTRKLLVTAWCVLSAVSILAETLDTPKAEPDQWRSEVASVARGKLMAVDPTSSYQGLLITSSDVGPFWVSQYQINKTSNITYRMQVFKDALSEDVTRRQAACEVFRREGVDTLIATPETEIQIDRFTRQCKYRPISRWVFTTVE